MQGGENWLPSARSLARSPPPAPLSLASLLLEKEMKKKRAGGGEEKQTLGSRCRSAAAAVLGWGFCSSAPPVARRLLLPTAALARPLAPALPLACRAWRKGWLGASSQPLLPPWLPQTLSAYLRLSAARAASGTPGRDPQSILGDVVFPLRRGGGAGEEIEPDFRGWTGGQGAARIGGMSRARRRRRFGRDASRPSECALGKRHGGSGFATGGVMLSP